MARVQINLAQFEKIFIAAIHAFLVKPGAELLKRRRLPGYETRFHQRGLRFDVFIRQREAFTHAA